MCSGSQGNDQELDRYESQGILAVHLYKRQLKGFLIKPSAKRVQPPQNIVHYVAISQCTPLCSLLKMHCTVQPLRIYSTTHPLQNAIHHIAPSECTSLYSLLQVYFAVQSSLEYTLLHSLLQNVFHYTTLLSLCLLYSPFRLYLALHLTSYVTLP